MSTTLLDCNHLALTAQDVIGIAPSFEDAGGNVCGCGDVSEACKVLGVELEAPPPPLPPSGM